MPAHSPSTHDSGLRDYILVYLALMVLLIATTGLDHLHLGAWNLIIVLAIAVIKAVLVLWYFMHARVSEKLVLYAFVVGLLMISIAFIFTLVDYAYRIGPA